MTDQAGAGIPTRLTSPKGMTAMSMAIVLLMSSVVAESATLTSAEQRDLRAAVYTTPAMLVVPERLLDGVPGPEFVAVPPAVKALYRRKPRPVIETLIKVMEGARPADSARAVAYALALLEGPSVGVLPVRHLEEETYDDPDTARINSRSRWVATVRRTVSEAGRIATR